MEEERFRWEDHRSELDRIFFKDFSLVPRYPMPHHHGNSIVLSAISQCTSLGGEGGRPTMRVTVPFSLSRGSREHKDFWTFFTRYQQFRARVKKSQKDGELIVNNV